MNVFYFTAYPTIFKITKTFDYDLITNELNFYRAPKLTEGCDLYLELT